MPCIGVFSGYSLRLDDARWVSTLTISRAPFSLMLLRLALHSAKSLQLTLGGYAPCKKSEYLVS